jgi:hypothetical protein
MIFLMSIINDLSPNPSPGVGGAKSGCSNIIPRSPRERGIRGGEAENKVRRLVNFID